MIKGINDGGVYTCFLCKRRITLGGGKNMIKRHGRAGGKRMTSLLEYGVNQIYFCCDRCKAIKFSENGVERR